MELRSYISKLFKSDISLGIWLIVIFTVARFALVLNTNLTGSYGTVWVIFVVMAIMPFLLLKRAGRSYIGIVPARSWLWILGSLLLGALACVVVYGIFTMFYGHSIENCFTYIYRYAEPSTPFDDKTRFIMFLVFSATTMTFSPIGEELLYRGVIHGCFAQSLGDRKASIIDSAAFAFVHISHYGINFIGNEWKIEFLPTILWVVSMYFTCRLFFFCKQKSGSVLGAIIAHAGFNIMTIYIVFYHIF